MTAATLLDGELHSQITTASTTSDAAWITMERELKRIRSANQRRDVYVKYIFTLIPSVQHSSQLVFAVDTIDPGVEYGKPGEPYELKPGAKEIPFGEPMVQPGFVEDKWGTWLEAYAPVQNSRGVTVAMLGVDIAAVEVLEKLNRLLLQGLIALAMGVILGLIAAWVLTNSMTKPMMRIVTAMQKIGEGQLDVAVKLRRKDEFSVMADAVNRMARALRERENLKSSLARYVSSHVADNILNSGQQAQLSGQRKTITVMFSDVRGFTSLSEKLSPEEVVKLLNEYFERMIEIVFRYNGTLDKFIGDGMMVFFGAPMEDPDHAKNAVRAALAMRREMQELTGKFRLEKNLELRIGIGIHTGPAVVGNIGSSQRMQYTAIGDTVNLAARLESATKDFGVDVLLSQDAKLAASGSEFQFHALDEISVKGRETKVMVYRVESA